MKGPEKYVFLFYSGHGDKKSGAWLVDTLDYPEGENLSF
jgi:hypothetical protein